MDEAFRKRLSDVISEIRGDLSQRDFAEKLGVAQSSVQGWEKGSNIPNLENLAKIASLRGQLPEELLAELYGRQYGVELPLEERVGGMTMKQLTNLLAILASRLQDGAFN
jgi:transcriptional regulator with XRE-family HTH domain